MWKTLTDKENKTLGYFHQQGEAFFFFGTRFCTKEVLSESFPHLSFCYLNQVHGAKLVPGEHEVQAEADGHWTNKKNSALCIRTADCLPVLLYDGKSIAAIHAGWRGLNQQILFQAKPLLLDGSVYALIGPHISFKHFEVEKAVAQQLLDATPHSTDLENLIRPHESASKRYVNLNEIARRQLQWTFPHLEVHSLNMDTYSNSLFASYRATATEERQYSFVALV